MAGAERSSLTSPLMVSGRSAAARAGLAPFPTPRSAYQAQPVQENQPPHSTIDTAYRSTKPPLLQTPPPELLHAPAPRRAGKRSPSPLPVDPICRHTRLYLLPPNVNLMKCFRFCFVLKWQTRLLPFAIRFALHWWKWALGFRLEQHLFHKRLRWPVLRCWLKTAELLSKACVPKTKFLDSPNKQSHGVLVYK